MGMRTSQTFIASFLAVVRCCKSKSLSKINLHHVSEEPPFLSCSDTEHSSQLGSLAAKRAPAPSEHSAILTALNNIAERQDRVEARLAALPQFDQAHAHGHLNVDQPTMATSTDVPAYPYRYRNRSPYARQGPPWPRRLRSQEVW